MIEVEVREGPDPDVRYFDMNRSLTGMALGVYPNRDNARGSGPADRLVRRLFDLGGVARVGVYSNVVTVTCAPHTSWKRLVPEIVQVIQNLFVHYDVNRV